MWDSVPKVVAQQGAPWLGIPECDCGPKRKLKDWALGLHLRDAAPSRAGELWFTSRPTNESLKRAVPAWHGYTVLAWDGCAAPACRRLLAHS